MEGHFTIRMSSQPGLLCVARAVVETAAKAIGFSEVQCNEVAMVINEALTNVIRHAYGGRTDQPISLRVEPCRHKGRDGIQIILEDESTDVDLERIEGRSLDEIRPGGLGVHIIRELMDEVQYTHRNNGTGVCLRMCKLLQPLHPTTTR